MFATNRSRLSCVTVAAVTLFMPLLTGCGSGSDMGATGTTISDGLKSAPVSTETRSAVKQIVSEVSRRAAENSSNRSATDTSVAFDGGFTASFRTTTDGATAGTISGPTSGLPATFQINNAAATDLPSSSIRYADGTAEEVWP